MSIAVPRLGALCALIVAGSLAGGVVPATAEALTPIDPGSRMVEFPLPNPSGLPSDIEAGSDGSVWIASYADKTVVHLALDGRVMAVARLRGGPSDLASDGAGGVWLTEYAANTVAHVSADATVKEFAVPTSNSFPAKIYDAGDAVFFTESDSQKLGRLTESSEHIDEFAIPRSSTPWEITGAGGEIWVSDTDANLTWIFGADGVVRDTITAWPGFTILDLQASDRAVEGFGVAGDQVLQISHRAGQPPWSHVYLDDGDDLQGVETIGNTTWIVEAGKNSVQAWGGGGGGAITMRTPDSALAGLTISGGRWVWTVGKNSGEVVRIDALSARQNVRHSGADRYETAVALSREHHAPGSETETETVFVVSGQNFADALSAGPIAAFNDAPILMTAQSRLPDATGRELERLDPRRVIVVGGSASVSSAVVDEIRSSLPAAAIRRIDGADRYAVSRALVTSDLAPTAGPLYIANGSNFPDALSSGPAAARFSSALLLVDGGRDQLSNEELKVITNYGTGGTVKITGGERSVSAPIAAQIATVKTVIRFGGADRFAVSEAINRDAFRSTGHDVFLASGASFPDALAGGPVAADRGAPIYLVQPGCIPEAVANEIPSQGLVHLLGGITTLSAAVDDLTVCR